MAEDSVQRRLAAIVVADVVGYSSHMERDPVGTRQRFRDVEAKVLSPLLAMHNGRIVKSLGDGFLIEFSSVAGAVDTAVQFQRRIDERFRGTADEALLFRIGINLGEIIVEGDDIHGDGVNVAARLEALAEPGGILLSERVQEQLQIAETFGIAYVGSRTIKNLSRPIRVYRVLLDPEKAGIHRIRKGHRRLSVRRWAVTAAVSSIFGTTLAAGLWFALQNKNPRSADQTGSTAAAGIPTVAVFPFKNLSPASARGYFAQGIAADLIIDLSKIRSISVIARSSSFSSNAAGPRLVADAQRLGARYIVSGSVRRHSGTLRITVQLTDVKRHEIVWGDRFDGTPKDIFRFQDQIVLRIVRQLRQRLSPRAVAAIKARGTSSPDAHDAYMLGMKLISSRRGLDTQENKAAMGAFRKAVRADPDYARGYAGLAWAHWLYFSNINYLSFQNRTRAFSLARKSLALKKNALAYRVLSKRFMTLNVLVSSERRPEIAVTHLEAAEILEPNNPDVLADLAETLPFIGRHRRALAKIERAIKLNPRYPHWYRRPLAIAQFTNGQYEKSALTFREYLAQSRVSQPYHVWLAAAWALAGKPELARETIAKRKQRNLALHFVTITAITRVWPLPEDRMKEFVRGLRIAGIPD